ncbi:unnamed protein product [Fraxinus pennsylvanica]|uniref:S-protein homolog n=1 Tax=Fraxinus pennsylvanica TaxID=56036 RepID=A0AAD2DU37_9LAMI|nr:unnamed protein product [Fraxinus pennsylvanica]
MVGSMAEKTYTNSTFLLLILTVSFIPAKCKFELFPDVEVTLANDGNHPIYFMCKYTDKDNSLYELPENTTYRFNFPQVAFPMRWCYLYINPRSHGFFWAYTVRSRCTKCFWSINRYPHLYRSDRARWERQQLFQPLNFNISDYFKKVD